MVRLLLPIAVALAACTPPSEQAAMRDHSPARGADAKGLNSPPAEQGRPSSDHVIAPANGDPRRAAVAPMPAPVPVTEHPLPAASPDSPTEAQGRRILSTAFVRVGPDGRLTVTLRDGHVLLLRNVTMRRKDYCGEQLAGAKPGAHYCGGYADVAAARPGDAPVSE